jgi:RHS repeat-associated protein
VAKQPEVFKYDLDGNLTNDGRWVYTWDGENRLVAMTNNTGVGPLYGLKFAYDPKGRRIQKTVTTNGTAFTTQNFVYDGWNLLAITNSQSSIFESFVWGTDLSGQTGSALNGAGGVGGLLEVSYRGTVTTNCFVAYDGNGNVAVLVSAADGTVVANYEYGPFGEVIRSTGPMAKANPFRFSTKYQDDESDLLYYGYRYYKASAGTWINRDPIGEPGFAQRMVVVTGNYNNDFNGYTFVCNDSIDYLDFRGLFFWWDIIIHIGMECVSEPHKHCSKFSETLQYEFVDSNGNPLKNSPAKKVCKYHCLYVDQPSDETVYVCATCDCPSGESVAENPPHHSPILPQPGGKP